MRRIFILITTSLFLIIPFTIPSNAVQGNCVTCRSNAINYGYIEEEKCLNQGGNASFCHSFFHANVCFYMTNYCSGVCSAQVVEALCQAH